MWGMGVSIVKNIFRGLSIRFRRKPATHPNPEAYHRFFDLGVQYYVIARFSAIAQLVPVSGNQYHHAVEMLLKAQLARTVSLKVLKQKCSHGLKRAWKDFKKLFPAEDLSPFDGLIRELDHFERIRYPDNVLNEGFERDAQLGVYEDTNENNRDESSRITSTL